MDRIKIESAIEKVLKILGEIQCQKDIDNNNKQYLIGYLQGILESVKDN